MHGFPFPLYRCITICALGLSTINWVIINYCAMKGDTKNGKKRKQREGREAVFHWPRLERKRRGKHSK